MTDQATPWAGGPGANLVSLANASGGALTVSAGLPTAFDVDRFIESGVFNRLFNLLWDLGIDIGQHGILEWHTDQNYLQHARVIGSDGNLYKAVQDNDGQDPTTDASNTYWALEAGATASNTEVEAGTDSGKAVTPSGLLSLFGASVNARWQGTEDEFGIVRLANATQTDASTASDRVVTPASLRRNLLAPLASPALTGNPTATTQASGNNSTRIATTAFVQDAVSGSRASYVHLSTAPSSANTNRWVWGSLESGANTYVAIDGTEYILPVALAPRGFIGYTAEIYEGSTLRGRVHVVELQGAGIYRHSSTERITVTVSAHTPSNSELVERAVSVNWAGSSRTTGWECRLYAIVI